MVQSTSITGQTYTPQSIRGNTKQWSREAKT